MSEIDDFEKFEDLMWDAEELANSPTKVAILEDAVRLADTFQSREAAFEARINLMDAACFSGQQEKMLVAFSWVLAEFDRDPDSYFEDQVLWRYKWVLQNVSEFPEIGVDRILALAEDFRTRLIAGGYGLHSYYGCAAKIYRQIGELKKAREQFDQWRSAERDSMSDCPACDVHDQAAMLSEFGDDSKALQVAEPLLKREQSCSDKPEYTYGMVMFPLVKLGRDDEADHYHRIGCECAAGEHQFLEIIGVHLDFKTFRRKLAEAVEWMQRHLSMAMDSMVPFNRLSYFSASRNLFDVGLNEKPELLNGLRIPKSIDVVDANGEYEIKQLRDWFDKRSNELASRFDKRNGNSFVSDSIEQMRKIVVEQST